MTRRWDVFEVDLVGPSSGNPFVEVELSAEFRHHDRMLVVEGFYDGDGIYRIRFMPDTEGEWSYTTRSNQPELDGRTGTFRCGPATSHGPVRVGEQNRFVYEDGSRYLCFGTTCYAWVHQPEALQEQTVRTLSSAPFNKLRMCVLPKHYPFNQNDPEVFPFVRKADGSFDLEQFDPRFWRMLERRIEQLREMGIEADLILFHPYDEGHWGFDRMSKEADDWYLRYTIARLASYRNVWWSLANEYDFMSEKHEEDWERYFSILREHDPYHRLRSIHNGSRWYDHTKPGVTHASVQSSDMAAGVRLSEEYGKPVVYDECCYEGNIEYSWGNITPETMTHRFWEGFLRGCSVGHGETYLHPEDILWWSKGGVLHGKSPERIAFLRRILEDAPAELAVDPKMFGWESTGIPVLRNGNRYFLICFGEHQPARKDLALPEDSDYSIEIIDTWNMTITEVPGSYRGTCLIDLPGRPSIALRIRADS